jgi:tricorn protease
MTGIAGWSRSGKEILFWSNAGQAFQGYTPMHAVSAKGGHPRELPWGPTNYITHGTKGIALGRHGLAPSKWKRYRGGRAGKLWVDPTGKGTFQRLIELNGNLASPMWIGSRIYFLSDHEGIGNIYSCTPSGAGLKRHTHQEEFYVRTPSTDGKRIIYHVAGDLCILDPKTDRETKVKIDWRSPRTQRNRKFVPVQRYLQSFGPHPRGKAGAYVVRGKAFRMDNWEGATIQHGKADGVRYRHAQYLPDGKRIVAITDEGGEETLQVFPGKKLAKLNPGRALDMVTSPVRDEVVLANHRQEVIWIDLAKGRRKVLDRSDHGRISGIAWSPDGNWVAYGFQETPHVSRIRLANVKTGKVTPITQAVLRDTSPAFDPEGKYLYFLSYRVFNPVYDAMHFDLGFPLGMKPYAVTLRKDLRSPFFPQAPEEPPQQPEKGSKKKKPQPLKIDLEGIENRVVAFPAPEAQYTQIEGIKGAALYSTYPSEGTLDQGAGGPLAPKGTLKIYRFGDQREEVLINAISGFDLSADRSTLYYHAAGKIRAIKAGEKPAPPLEKLPPSRKSGWIDLNRIKVSVDPQQEWEQMYREIWRLMRDHFWVADMSGVDWNRIYSRYKPLLKKIATRSEFSDLIWEMQGETGTSHCYEMGGDYRRSPHYSQGFLGVDFTTHKKGWKITRVVQGDGWEENTSSPLSGPGVRAGVGSVLTSVNGRTGSPGELLVNQAGAEVSLAFANKQTINVKTLRDETPARYREWVNQNRAAVHKGTKGRVGYVHIPDMGPSGYAEFHRSYLAEVDREGLIVDVRYNRGGHVSQLLLEKLCRERIGYDLSRWGVADPYPGDSVGGPMVALTNENAGSDGDIFSHCWKLRKLGPLVGRRTWGGVVGIWPRHSLVDGSVTTQPEFSFWFVDVGFGVENYGTDPDMDVDIAPHDYAKKKDPQMETGLATILDLLRKNPPKKPRFAPRPKLTLPKLPRNRK